MLQVNNVSKEVGGAISQSEILSQDKSRAKSKDFTTPENKSFAINKTAIPAGQAQFHTGEDTNPRTTDEHFSAEESRDFIQKSLELKMSMMSQKRKVSASGSRKGKNLDDKVQAAYKLQDSLLKLKRKNTVLHKLWFELAKSARNQETLDESQTESTDIKNKSAEPIVSKVVGEQKVKSIFMNAISFFIDFLELSQSDEPTEQKFLYHMFGGIHAVDFLVLNAELILACFVSEAAHCLSLFTNDAIAPRLLQRKDLVGDEQRQRLLVCNAFLTKNKDLIQTIYSLTTFDATSKKEGLRFRLSHLNISRYLIMYQLFWQASHNDDEPDIYQTVQIFKSKFTSQSLQELLVDLHNEHNKYKGKSVLISKGLSDILVMFFRYDINEGAYLLLNDPTLKPVFIEMEKGIAFYVVAVCWMRRQLDDKVCLINTRGIYIEDAVKSIEVLKSSSWVADGALSVLTAKDSETLPPEVSKVFKENLDIVHEQLVKIDNIIQNKNDEMHEEKRKLQQWLQASEALKNNSVSALKVIKDKRSQPSSFPVANMPSLEAKEHPEPNKTKHNIDAQKEQALLDMIYSLFCKQDGEEVQCTLAEFLARIDHIDKDDKADYAAIGKGKRNAIIELAKMDAVLLYAQTCLKDIHFHFDSIQRYKFLFASKGFDGTFDRKDAFVTAVRLIPQLSHDLTCAYETLNIIVGNIKKASAQYQSQMTSDSFTFMKQGLQEVLDLFLKVGNISEDILEASTWRKQALFERRDAKLETEKASEQSNNSKRPSGQAKLELTTFEVKDGVERSKEMFETIKKFDATLKNIGKKH